jgi:hypothetical protein
MPVAISAVKRSSSARERSIASATNDDFLRPVASARAPGRREASGSMRVEITARPDIDGLAW